MRKSYKVEKQVLIVGILICILAIGAVSFSVFEKTTGLLVFSVFTMISIVIVTKILSY